MALVLAGCTGGKSNEQPQQPEPPPATTVPTPGTEEPDPSEKETAKIQLFFTKDEAAVPVERELEATEDLVKAALYELVKGPTEAEQAEGIGSWFSAETANVIQEITHEEHTVIVNFTDDLRRLIPNASTSAGSAILLSNLRETAFQFADVEELELQLDGSCVAFGDWLQTGECMVIRR